MKSFVFAAPTSLDEAVDLLSHYGDGARPLAGGTDLLAQMKDGGRNPEAVVDVKRIPELMEIHFDPQQGLRIGAGVPCHTIYTHPAVREHYPALWASTRIIGSIQIQNRATLGGNLCNASPSADTVPALMVLDAAVLVVGPGGTRQLPVGDIPTGPKETCLEPGELVVSFQLPPAAARSGSHYLRFIPRNEMDIAVAGAGAWLQLDPEGHCTAARIALAAVAPVALRAHEAEEALLGQTLGDDVIEEACRRAVALARPISDVRGSAAYRRQLVGVLTRRAITAARQQILATA